MYSWMMNPKIIREWNDDALIVPSDQNERLERHANKLGVICGTGYKRISP